jgi:hypothetical protein
METIHRRELLLKMKRAQALDFINTLDSKHQSVQPALRLLARGGELLPDELNALASSDSRLVEVVPILRAINGGKADDGTVKAINALDSFGAPLQPVLLAMVHGFSE